MHHTYWPLLQHQTTKSAGTEPANKLLLNDSFLRVVSSPGHISAGTVPVNVLLDKSRELRLVKSPISEGSEPVKVLM